MWAGGATCVDTMVLTPNREDVGLRVAEEDLVRGRLSSGEGALRPEPEPLPRAGRGGGATGGGG